MKDFYTYTLEKTQELLKTDIEKGLTYEEVRLRLKKNGKNEISEQKKRGIVSKFTGQLNDFLIIVLIIAAIISFIVGILEGGHDLTEPVIILLIVVINATIGVFQESRAEKSLEMLKKMSAPTCRVVRDGKISEIDATELVQGDILVFKTGDIIAADAVICEGTEVFTLESAITGESSPVHKSSEKVCNENTPLAERKNMLFSSTSVVSGYGRAIVVATGMDTEVGKVAGMILNSDNPETPLQKRMAEFGKKIAILALIICVLVFFVGIFSGVSALEMFITSVSLAVAAIPEGLPAIVTVMLAIGVSNLAKKKALVRHLPSVETLGSAGVICTDKTGTVTENKMKVTEVFTEDEKLFCSFASLCCMKDSHNPTELAILNFSKERVDKDNKYTVLKEIPFSSKLKKMTVMCRMGNKNIIISKGAADVLLRFCTRYRTKNEEIKLTFEKKREIEKKLELMADSGLRVIAVTYKDTTDKNISENNMVFLGLFGIEDPPRPEAAPAVEVCKRAGIIPVMITGDHLKTAVAIAKKTGIFEDGKKTITGYELDRLSDEELAENITDFCVFARVSPEHKVRIVKAWQARGEIVAMTGDGVNDAPALKCADIGCSLGIAGTDVAKAASDMVLTDDNFATVVSAVRHGRLIFKNITKTVKFLLSSNMGEIVTIFLGMLMGFPPPLLAIQLLWVNLVTDSLPAIALGIDGESDEDLLKNPSQESFFSKSMMIQVCFQGLLIGTLALVAFCIGNFKFLSLDTARTMAFSTLSISQLIHAFNMHSEKSIFKSSPFKNVLLVISALVGIIMQVAVVEINLFSKIFKVTPLTPIQWSLVSVLALMPLAVIEVQKFINFLFDKKKTTKKHKKM